MVVFSTLHNLMQIYINLAQDMVTLMPFIFSTWYVTDVFVLFPENGMERRELTYPNMLI